MSRAPGRNKLSMAEQLRLQRERVQNIHRNPLTGGIARKVAHDRIRSYCRNVQIGLYQQTPGQEATQYLAKLGWLIALATETELQGAGITPELRRLHGGLRQIQDACLRGYRWPDINPAGLDLLVDLAIQTVTKLPEYAMAFITGANHFEAEILQHKVTPQSISGAEIYQEVAEHDRALP